MTIYWAPLLHIYQPATQDLNVLRSIDKECYKPLFSLFEEYDDVKFCLNINGILIELLYEFGLSDTMNLIKNLVSEKKIEIVGTAKFHPILPLIPKKEMQRQIEMNEEINRREFDRWQKKGFFPPELAISESLITLVQKLKYKWIIMSGIACPVDWPYNKIYNSSNGLQLFFRDEILSNKIAFNDISPDDFVKSLIQIFQQEKNPKIKKNKEINKYVITAMDGETFGHHIKNFEKTFLKKVLDAIIEEEQIEILSISELDQYFPTSPQKVVPRESSWSTTYEDLQSNIPFPLWKHPDNNIHKYYWKIMKSVNNLMNLAENLDLASDRDIENYYTTARFFYNQGVYSCPVWWANPQNGMWSPNLIYKGFELLMKAALNAQMALVHAGKSDLGEAFFDSISYYHGLCLMELYTITKEHLKKKKI